VDPAAVLDEGIETGSAARALRRRERARRHVGRQIVRGHRAELLCDVNPCCTLIRAKETDPWRHAQAPVLAGQSPLA
jgi:hypothetical protein